MKGVTLIELIIVVSILSVLALLAFIGIATLRENIDLESVGQNVLSTLRFAQTKTVASESDTVYGIHFETDRYVLFEGASYSAGAASNEVHVLPTTLEFASWSIGGGSEVIFARVTGATSQTGTIVLQVEGDSTRSRTIAVLASGQVTVAGSAVSQTGTRITDTRHVHYTLGWSMSGSTTMRLFFPSVPNVTEDISIPTYTSGGKFDWSGTVDVNGSNQVLRIHSHLLDPFNTILSVHRERDENTNAVDISVDGNLITRYDAAGNVTLGPFGGTMEAQ